MVRVIRSMTVRWIARLVNGPDVMYSLYTGIYTRCAINIKIIKNIDNSFLTCVTDPSNAD